MIKASVDDWYTIAKTAWGEARGEQLQGIEAVCWTVVNRLQARTWYGDSIEEVCLKPFQYSCWNQNDPNRNKLLLVQPSDPDFRRCLGVAALVLSSDFVDPTQGATHYHVKDMAQPPDWASSPQMVPTAIIGRHRFYREL